jgi:hypothetical protein
MRRFLQKIAVAALVTGVVSPALAQSANTARELTVTESFMLDPALEKEGDAIKQQTYRSSSVGKKQNWNLDIGHFSEGQFEETSLEDRLADQSDRITSYAGVRFRVPLSGN